MVPAAPALFITAAATGVNTPPELIVKVPFTLKLLFAATAALVLTVRPEKVNVPELLSELPFAIVTVPPDAVSDPLDPTEIAVPTLKEFDVVTVAEAATASVLNASVLELLIVPPFIVIVPPPG
jgi:hypothetical protein